LKFIAKKPPCVADAVSTPAPMAEVAAFESVALASARSPDKKFVHSAAPMGAAIDIARAADVVVSVELVPALLSKLTRSVWRKGAHMDGALPSVGAATTSTWL
jgi:hypothetical protein